MVQAVSTINRAIRQLGMADESEYFIKIDQFNDDAFIVESINLDQWNLTDANYQLNVKILALIPVEPDDLIGKSASVNFLWRGAFAPITGLVTQLSDADGNGDYAAYRVTIQSPLWMLKHQNRNRVFVEKNSLDIASELLNELADGFFTVTVQASAPANYPMIVQYNESDWDFLYRILLRDGIMIHQYQTSGAVEVHLVDDVSQLPLSADVIALPFRSSKGAAIDEEYVSMVKKIWSHQPNQVTVADYQFPTSEALHGSGSNDSNGLLTDHRWGLNPIDNDNAQKLAENIATAHSAALEHFLFHTNCRGIQPGMSVELTGHQALNGQYLVIQVECSGSQGDAVNMGASTNSKGFQCVFLAVPNGKPYLPLLKPRQPLSGSITATVSGEIDESGLYQVRLPFDGDNAEGETSLPTRLAQPFGGSDHGMHFPLTKGTEVVLTFENGDIDRPTILGAVYNDQSPNLVTSENPYENLIRTRSQHEFLLDDSPGEEKIKLQTAEEKNHLHLDATTDSHKISLSTEEGDIELFAGKNMQAQSGGDMTMDVGANQEVTVKGDYSLMTEEGDITHHAGANIQLTATEDLSWVTEEGQLHVQVGGQFIVEAAEGSSTHVVAGDQIVVVEDGSFQLEAASDIAFSAGGAITFTQGDGSIQIDSSGNLTLDGPSVEVTADKIIIKGGTVGNN